MALTDPVAGSFAGKRLFIHEENKLQFGYTTADFNSRDLKHLFPARPLLFLKQVHSARIVSDAEWRVGSEADGLLLERPGMVAVIQTADCLPLFFCDDSRRRGGILHVGWRGLQQGIEEKLIARLGKELGDFSFFLGPAIEKSCYEVGEELLGLFAEKSYGERIFSPVRPGKYSLDIRSGLELSLLSAGVAAERISGCGLCTYCSRGLFPSFRRDGGSGRRIFNFLLLKGNGPAGA